MYIKLLKFVLSISLVLAGMELNSQAILNDDCEGITRLGTAPICDAIIFSNIHSTPSDIQFDNNPPCFNQNPPQNDVWFSFVAVNDFQDYSIRIEGIQTMESPAIHNIQAALYRGTCKTNGMALRACAVSDFGSSILEFEVAGLKGGEEYILRIDNFSNDESEGIFSICIDEREMEMTIDEEGTNACQGVLYDSGGPDEDYSANEDLIFTICPETVHKCIKFELQYYQLQDDGDIGGDKLIFYNGQDTTAEIIEFIGSDNSMESSHGGGGVCKTVYAENCLTVRFQSDETINSSGFMGSWSCSIFPCDKPNPIKITKTTSASDIVNAVTSNLASVQLDTIRCDGDAYGIFEIFGKSDLGLNKGILLTTGNIFDALGPNSDDAVSTEFELPGDEDLDSLSFLYDNGSFSQDACVLEFDVQAFSNELNFEYIFGSDEYPEFVDTKFNDIFALLISGPGIEDGIPELNDQKNLAILPGKGDLVQINSVNHLENWEYYRNNASGLSIEYDGLSSDFLGKKKSLTASSSVIPCETYHLKFAIADRGDRAIDSGVFIADISSGAPSITANFSSGLDFFVEGCVSGFNSVVIQLDKEPADSIMYSIELDGTAKLGEDYNLDIPDSIYFTPGQTRIEYSIEIIGDLFEESSENILINLYNETSCGKLKLSSLEIPIYDQVDLYFENQNDSIEVCKGSEFHLSVSGAKQYYWEPALAVDDPYISNPLINTDDSQWFYVSGSLDSLSSEICLDSDSIFVEIIDPQISIISNDNVNICKGDSISLNSATDIPGGIYSWSSPAGILQGEQLPSITLYPNLIGQNQKYELNYEVANCFTSDFITVNVDDFLIPEITTTDTSLCEGDQVTLASGDYSEFVTYHWEPDLFLNDAASPTPEFVAQEDIRYTFSAISSHEYCRYDTSIDIRVHQSNITVEVNENTDLCKGDSLSLSATYSSDDSIPVLSWYIPDPSQIISGTDTIHLVPQGSGNIIARLTDSHCISYDSVFVKVDSIPKLPLELLPEDQTYCPGELISIISDGFERDLFPDMIFQWQSGPGIVSELGNLNITFTTTESHFYHRSITNGSCFASDSIFVQVIDPTIQIDNIDPVVCPGEEIILSVSGSPDLDSVTWSEPVNCLVPGCQFAAITILQDVDIEAIGLTADCDYSDSISLKFENVSLDLTKEPVGTIPLGEDIEIKAEISGETPNESSARWYRNQISFDSGVLTISDPTSNSIAVYSIEYQTENGCLIKDSVTVITDIPTIEFPNVFRPDSEEALNKTFTYVVNLDGTYFEDALFGVKKFNIYNRWGEIVFKCAGRNCATEGWDGTINGKKAPGDVYIFSFEAVLPNGEEVLIKGDVMLLR